MTAPPTLADETLDAPQGRDGGRDRRGGRATWRHAAGWCGAAAAVLLVTLVVVDNFVVVELRLPGASITARLGWIVVVATALGFVGGWLIGRVRRRPAGAGTRRSRSGPTAVG